MSLDFKKTPEGDFLITQTTFSANDTRTMTVLWRADLSEKQVNSDPWRKTTECDRDRFRYHFLEKFE